jgi:transcriptional regulator with XRE-family HTH domain
MPASKQINTVAVLRKNLHLRQTELAEMVGCHVASIQSIELNRLKLSPALASRISLKTGVDLAWLRNNDVAVPMPPIKRLGDDYESTDQAKDAIYPLLVALFDRLFRVVRSLPKNQARMMLELNIGWQLESLNRDSVPEHFFYTNAAEFFRANPGLLDADLGKLINLDYLAQDLAKNKKRAAKGERQTREHVKKTLAAVLASVDPTTSPPSRRKGRQQNRGSA